MSHSAPLPACSILLLAGGRGQRMGGQDKGLLEWRGQPLISHLHALARPLSDDLIISCNRNQPRYTAYADRLVEDAEADFPGPLAGILAGLAVARHDWLLVLPCDAPLLDLPLLHAMRTQAANQPDKPLMLRRGEQWEPLLCLLPRTLHLPLQQAWQQGERSPRRALLQLDPQALDCAPDDPRLANLNTPHLLADASVTGQ
ncbi:molybdenum cofactor guanylyltransferase MobA [Aquipseudomonas ullengensis]|uniref:Molybdenum cofactor guanylyltransferase n=1 Tax=Aquipseudomonas ullengensis TaxID=2759166 RepID=A0A7W4LNV0_9GAMM|nr:molybdenum cofactor guanylyltransferase MobA [Pseudomonas ullengensis]MBB2496460.1 molybdenum cofactor guanylyltransferase MobA [Pseudomonas ullengensis]